MPKPIIYALACGLLFCLSAGCGAAAQDGRFLTVPPFVFPTPPDLRTMTANQSAGFCFAKMTDNRAYLIVALRNTTRTIDATERALDRLARDLGLEAESFVCPPEVLGRSLLVLLSESGKELREFVVPDLLLGAPGQRQAPFRAEPLRRNSPIVERR
jgi:hypothetical protein